MCSSVSAGLQPSSKGARVKLSGGKRTVIDGAFAKTKELIARYWIIQVKSREEAIEWAKRVPASHEGQEVEIEIRQFASWTTSVPARRSIARASSARSSRRKSRLDSDDDPTSVIEALEAEHRLQAELHPSMVLLHDVVQVWTATNLHRFRASEIELAVHSHAPTRKTGDHTALRTKDKVVIRVEIFKFWAL